MSRELRKIDSLGERIKYARNFKGFDRKGLASKLGIPVGDLADYEKGVGISDTRTLKEISRLCMFDIYWLETGKEKYLPSSDEEAADSKD